MKRLVLALGLLALPSLASAQNQCVGLIGLDYTNPPLQFLSVGAVLNVQGSLGAGNVVGGTHVLYNKVQIQLDCLPSPTLTPQNCVDAGPAVSYLGDATISTNCPGIVWTSNNPGGGTLPNTVEFDATPVLAVPEINPIPPGFCNLNFDLMIVNEPPTVPTTIAQILGYSLAVCNTQPILTTSGFQTASGSFAVEEEVPYNCYETRKGALTSKKTVSIEDVFGTGSLTMSQLTRFCAPANKNDENPEAIALPGHLAGYPFSNFSGTFNKPNGVTFSTQFGTYTVNVRNPKRLLVPSSKSKLGPPPDMPLPPGTIRHFLCHDVDNVSGPKPTGTSAEDQFNTLTINTASLGASTLCASANKNDEDPDAVTDPTFLFCIDSKTDTPFPDTNLFFNNQFGPSNLQFKNPPPFFESLDELCVPATIIP